jgi:hypothetical protein
LTLSLKPFQLSSSSSAASEENEFPVVFPLFPFQQGLDRPVGILAAGVPLAVGGDDEESPGQLLLFAGLPADFDDVADASSWAIQLSTS